MKQEIEKFIIQDDIYFWKYLENERNFPGWNISFNKTAGESLIDLLNLMNNCEWSSKKAIEIKHPTNNELQIVNNQSGTAKWKFKPSLVLNHRKDETSLWEILEKENEIEIRFGKERLTEFLNATMKMSKRINDFGIYEDDENCLYFW